MGFLDDAWEWTGGALEDAGKAMMSAAEETAGVVVDGVNFLYNAAGEVVDAMGNLIIDGVTYSAGFATTVAAPIVDAAEMVEVWVQDWDGSWITDFVEKSMSAGYRLVEGVGHLDIVDAPETEAAIRNWLAQGVSGS